MSRSEQIRGVVALALALAVAACGGGSSGAKASPPTTKTTTEAAACSPRPAAGPAFAWLPADLPLPPGSYPVREVASPGAGAASTIHHGELAVPVTVREWIVFVRRDWPRRGWILGRGDAERDEAENAFSRGSASGVFRIRPTYCDRAWSQVLVTYGERAG